jgi:dTDP-4-dehydrorhamnose reductase
VKVVICGADGQLGRALQASLDGHSVTALASHLLDITDLQHPRILLPPCEQDLREFAEEQKKGTH